MEPSSSKIAVKKTTVNTFLNNEKESGPTLVSMNELKIHYCGTFSNCKIVITSASRTYLEKHWESFLRKAILAQLGGTAADHDALRVTDIIIGLLKKKYPDTQSVIRPNPDTLFESAACIMEMEMHPNAVIKVTQPLKMVYSINFNMEYGALEGQKILAKLNGEGKIVMATIGYLEVLKMKALENGILFDGIINNHHKDPEVKVPAARSPPLDPGNLSALGENVAKTTI